MEEGHKITNEILKKAIACEFSISEHEVNIERFQVSQGSNKGDNFLCVMKAVEVEAIVEEKKRKLFYMAKCIPINAFRAKFLLEVRNFNHNYGQLDTQ